MSNPAAMDCQSHFVLIVNGSNDGMPSRLYKDGQPVAFPNSEALSTVTPSVRSPASSSCVSTLGVNSFDGGPAWRGYLTPPSSGFYSRGSPKSTNVAATYDVRSPAIVLAERYIQQHQLKVDQQMADYDMRMELRDIDDWNPAVCELCRTLTKMPHGRWLAKYGLAREIQNRIIRCFVQMKRLCV